VRDGMVEPGGVASSPDGRLWRVLKLGDEKVGGDLKRIVRGKLNPGVNYFHLASMRLIGPAS
jgi:hypothetical protein